MNRKIITVLLLFVVLAYVIIPAAAETEADEKIFSGKSKYFNVGYTIVIKEGEDIWTIWNTENACKVIEANDDNIDRLESFKKSVDICQNTEEGDYVTYSHVRWWTYLGIWIKNLLGLPVEREIAESWANDADYHFDHL